MQHDERLETRIYRTRTSLQKQSVAHLLCQQACVLCCRPNRAATLDKKQALVAKPQLCAAAFAAVAAVGADIAYGMEYLVFEAH
jgi:hypothetical protein